LVTSSVENTLKYTIEGKTEEATDVTRRQRRKCKQLVDNLKEMRRYRNLKEEALDHT
jgi:hypothetical protein